MLECDCHLNLNVNLNLNLNLDLIGALSHHSQTCRGFVMCYSMSSLATPAAHVREQLLLMWFMSTTLLCFAFQQASKHARTHEAPQELGARHVCIPVQLADAVADCSHPICTNMCNIDNTAGVTCCGMPHACHLIPFSNKE